jgi:protein phosphatase-4 regulatory subunit 3
VVEKVLKLLQRKERWLVVAGVRFLRTCIGTKVGQGLLWAVGLLA